jgi:hypothetical protein
MKIAARSWMESWMGPNAMPSIRTSTAGPDFHQILVTHRGLFSHWDQRANQPGRRVIPSATSSSVRKQVRARVNEPYRAAEAL